MISFVIVFTHGTFLLFHGVFFSTNSKYIEKTAAKASWHSAMKVKYVFEWKVISLSGFKCKKGIHWSKGYQSGSPRLNGCIEVEVAFNEWLLVENSKD